MISDLDQEKKLRAKKWIKLPLILGIGFLLGMGTQWMIFQNFLTESEKNKIVAEYDGKRVKASEVFQTQHSLKLRLAELEEDIYRTKEQAIQDFLDRKILEKQSKKENLPVEILLDKASQSHAIQVSEQELEDFKLAKSISPEDSRFKKEDLISYLKYVKRFEKRKEYLSQLKREAKARILLPEPMGIKVNIGIEGYPSWGNPSAPVTIVQFSDFQCIACGRIVAAMERIRKEYRPDQVRIIYRDLPMARHEKSISASMAAYCANEQGKFLEYQHTLFENQQRLEEADLKEYGKVLALEEGKFVACITSQKYKSTIERGIKEAETAGIQVPPTILINGVILPEIRIEKLKERIDRILQGSKV